MHKNCVLKGINKEREKGKQVLESLIEIELCISLLH